MSIVAQLVGAAVVLIDAALTGSPGLAVAAAVLIWL